MATQERGLASVVYLICLERPLSPDHTARHYLGSADDLCERVKLHRASQGSRFLAVANERGIGWEVVRTWQADDARGLERRLKAWKNGPQLCPHCRPRRLPALHASKLSRKVY